ncbi:MAG: response regulator [Ignavibacteriaceae bacterium]|jgi:CheY-like chemotaxis protein|nr:response regulator [Ignavibacteriaceae bacterium]
MTIEAPTILLVEDNEDHAELVKRGLEKNKIANKLIHVNDGEKAIDYLLSNPAPHLVLLDLRLPKIDGIAVLKKIKTMPELKKIPVVVLTSSESPKDIESSYSNYVNSYLVKPIDFSKFHKLLDDLGYYWLLCNKNPNS